MHRTLLFVELGMDFVIGHLWCRLRVAVEAATNSFFVVNMGDGVRILGGQHLVDGLPRFDMAVKAIGNSLIQKVSGLAVKCFAVREYGFGRQVVPGDDLFVVMASGTCFGNVSRISNFVQASGHVIVKPVDKII